MDNKRLKLGIIFNFSAQWMGGIIYVINLAKTLNHLEDKDKPEIFLFYQPELGKFLEEFKYPYINLIEWPFPSVVRGNLRSWILRKNVFYNDLIKKYDLDAVYPAKNFPVKNKTRAKVVAWYADLQHKYYPEFFSRLTIIHRNIRLYFMLKNASDLIVSSEAVKNDFHKFYKPRKDLKFHVYHFTSINDDYLNLDINELRKKYNLPEKYFLISNQFHKHKNHRVLLLALAKLKEMGINKHFAITGKFPRDSDSPYLKELYRLIEDNKLQDHISLMGIIPRGDQIKIMEHAQAVLQPSLFEGWSTVIEDAISLQVPVIASNLPVNIEQLKDNGVYFDPHDADELASILSKYPDRNINDKPYEDYSLRIRESAELLVNVFSQ
ncbi:MAG: glycosyltransferase family 4 protein [Bacteroidales bacterium]|nr:glycosyltransferase family 4 protein [Bacteroidales bacterium]